MSKQEKLEALKAFLEENKIEYDLNYESKGCKVMFDLRVIKQKIVVHMSDDHDQEFYLNTRRKYHPFFIREGETVEFIIEKMQNCLYDCMMSQQKKIDGKRLNSENYVRHMEKVNKKAQKAEKPKRKRQRIVRYEKV